MEEDESKITGKREATDRGNKLGTLVLLSATLIRDISHTFFLSMTLERFLTCRSFSDTDWDLIVNLIRRNSCTFAGMHFRLCRQKANLKELIARFSFL